MGAPSGGANSGGPTGSDVWGGVVDMWEAVWGSGVFNDQGTSAGGAPSPPQAPLATFEQRHTVDWMENWPILAAVGGLALVVLLRR